MRTRQLRLRCHDQGLPPRPSCSRSRSRRSPRPSRPRDARSGSPRRSVDSSRLPADAPVDARIDESRITDLPAGEGTGHRPSSDRTGPPHRHQSRGDGTRRAFRESANRSAARRSRLARRRPVGSRAWMEGERVEATDRPPREAAASVAVTALALKAFAQAAPRGRSLSGPATKRSASSAADSTPRGSTDSPGVGSGTTSPVRSRWGSSPWVPTPRTNSFSRRPSTG